MTGASRVEALFLLCAGAFDVPAQFSFAANLQRQITGAPKRLRLLPRFCILGCILCSRGIFLHCSHIDIAKTSHFCFGF